MAESTDLERAWLGEMSSCGGLWWLWWFRMLVKIKLCTLLSEETISGINEVERMR